MKFSISNLWVEVGTTVTAVIAIAGAVGPFIVNQKMPSNAAEWALFGTGMVMAIVKAFGSDAAK